MQRLYESNKKKGGKEMKQDTWIKKGKMYVYKTDDFKPFIETIAKLWMVCDEKNYDMFVTVKKSKNVKNGTRNRTNNKRK